MSSYPHPTDRDDPIAAVWAEVRPGHLRLARELIEGARRVTVDPGDAATWQQVRTTSHRLADSLGTFDQAIAAEAATSLDEVVSTVDTPDAAVLAQAVGLAEAIVAALELDG